MLGKKKFKYKTVKEFFKKISKKFILEILIKEDTKKFSKIKKSFNDEKKNLNINENSKVLEVTKFNNSEL